MPKHFALRENKASVDKIAGRALQVVVGQTELVAVALVFALEFVAEKIAVDIDKHKMK